MDKTKLFFGVENLIGEEELLDKLAQNKKLKVKFGVDPTRPDLTFGHMVVFNKLRQFQEMGHEAILLPSQIPIEKLAFTWLQIHTCSHCFEVPVEFLGVVFHPPDLQPLKEQVWW